MVNKSSVLWSVKELTECLRKRQLNRFDVNIGVSGKRGNGKSTCLFKIFHSFRKHGFRQKKQQVYSREDVVNLLSSQKFGFCWDDEAINSGYKRKWQEKGQQDLIQVVTNYRDNFNIYASALPFFYSLDKDLRELIFMHIHIIERGYAVILMPIGSSIHSQDPWDTAFNKKIEEQENKRIQKNPELSFRYHRFSTFAGYLYFGDMTPKQRKRYEEIKKEKRAKALKIEEGFKEEIPFMEKLYQKLLEKKLTKSGIIQMCYMEDRKFSSVNELLNRMLKDRGHTETVKHFLKKSSEEENHNNVKDQIDDLIPTI